MAVSYSGQVPHFLESFLGRPASALPKGALWVVDFEGLDSVRDAIKKTAELEPGKGWNIVAGLNCLIKTEAYKNKGCLFCQAVSVPGEQTIVNPEGIQKGHFIRTATGDGRSDYTTGLKMTFLDTNVSFVDNVLRPWVVTTARLGLIARTGRDQYRQNISIYKLGVLKPAQPPFVLQKYLFKGACPVEVSTEEYNYTASTSPINREATFTFHSYELDTNFNNSNLAIYNNTPQPSVDATRLGVQI